MTWRGENESAFSGTAPTSWTALDLSSIVGLAHRLVLLVVEDNSVGTAPRFRFRPRGETAEWGRNGPNTGPFGTTQVRLNSNGAEPGVTYAGLVLVETDDEGGVEWICSSAGACSVGVVGYEDSYHHDGVMVYDGTSPNPADWTDLDLSAYLGERDILAFCAVSGLYFTTYSHIALRPDTDLYTSDRRYEAAGGDDAAGCAAVRGVNLAEKLGVIVETDAAGEVEFYDSKIGTSLKVELVGHVPHWEPDGTQYGPLAGVASWTSLDLSTEIGNVSRLVLLEASHDDAGEYAIAIQKTGDDASGTVKYDHGDSGYSAGTQAATVESGKVVVLACVTDASGTVEWITDSGSGVDWTFRLIGSPEPQCGTRPVLSRQYPTEGSLVAEDTEIRFRIADDYGVQLPTLQVRIESVDQVVAFIEDGAFTSAASGLIQELTGLAKGYDVTIFPSAPLGDRVWSVVVEGENLDGMPTLLRCGGFGAPCTTDDDCCTGTCDGCLCLGVIG